MGRIALGTACSADDPALRRLVAEAPMGGRIGLSFRREPSYFGALAVEGTSSDVIVARDEQGNIVAMGNRSIRNLLVDDQRTAVGYLSGLRLARHCRKGTLLHRGYRFLRELDRDGRAAFYLTTIVEDNEIARRALAGRRKGMPVYHDLGGYYCAALSMAGPRRAAGTDGLAVRAASSADVRRIAEFLSAEGRKRQFFPVYEQDDLLSRTGLLQGLRVEDILLAFSGSELCGVAALWDQSASRQLVVGNYAFPVRQVRPVYNLVAPWLRMPSLPAAGCRLSCLYLSLVCVKDDDAAVFRALLGDLCGGQGSRGALLLCGFHERDPLLSVIRRYRHVRYTSRVYAVSWEGDPGGRTRFDECKIPYLELGAL